MVGSIYYDAVLDDNMRPVFNGTQEETVKWLTDSASRFTDTYRVCVGMTMRLMEISDYLKYVERFEAVKLESKRYNKVHELVMEAMKMEPKVVEASQITEKIMQIFKQ